MHASSLMQGLFLTMGFLTVPNKIGNNINNNNNRYDAKSSAGKNQLSSMDFKGPMQSYSS